MFLTGCTNQVYVQKSVLQETIINKDTIYSLSYVVVNPTDYTFVGNISYDYNKDCLMLRGSPEIDQVEVSPKKSVNGQFFKVREFQYRYRREPNSFGAEQVPPVNCFQTPFKITIHLYDRNGGLIYSDGATLILTN